MGMAALLWLVVGVAGFGFLTNFLLRTFPEDRLQASFWLSIGFSISTTIIVALIVIWQRAHGESLADLGWRRPTTVTAIVVSVLFGALWTSTAYIQPGSLSFFSFPWQRVPMAVIGVFLAFGEELAMRGFFMEQLRRAKVPTWIQVISAGVCMGLYHGLLGRSYSLVALLASTIIFTIVGLLFVLGKRSLLPGTLAHAMTHFFGDPSLMMGIFSAAAHLAHR